MELGGDHDGRSRPGIEAPGPLLRAGLCTKKYRHTPPPGSGPGRNKDADDALHSTPACPHTCVHAVVLRFTTGKILWHDCRAMLRSHGELRQTSCLGLLCERPALNRCTVFRMTTFFRIPIVRFRTVRKTETALDEDKACPCTKQIERCNLRQTWHHKLKRELRPAASAAGTEANNFGFKKNLLVLIEDRGVPTTSSARKAVLRCAPRGLARIGGRRRRSSSPKFILVVDRFVPRQRNVSGV